MLAAHLDPSTPAASAPPDVIDARVEWIAERLGLRPGDSLVDLGCGPGLYTERFARHGLEVTGIDISSTSIEYARSNEPQAVYRCEDYLTMTDAEAFDAATLIYGDYCTFGHTDRARLLHNVHRSLKTDGWFVLDVSTEKHHISDNCGDGWWVSPGRGFWKPGPHLVLSRHFQYPEESLALDQYAIVEANGKLSVYRNWFRHFDAASITAELESGGFEVRGLYGDLAGKPLDPDGHWIGVVAQRNRRSS